MLNPILCVKEAVRFYRIEYGTAGKGDFREAVWVAWNSLRNTWSWRGYWVDKAKGLH